MTGDVIDQAQAREELDRELALAAARARIEASFAARDEGVEGTCIDCGESIEPARMEALRGCCSRCFGCAERFELEARR